MVLNTKFKKILKYIGIIITFTVGIILLTSVYILILGGPIPLNFGGNIRIIVKGISIFPLSLEYVKISLPNFHTDIVLSIIKKDESKIKIKKFEIISLFQYWKRGEQDADTSPISLNYQKFFFWLEKLGINELTIENISILAEFNASSYGKISGLKAKLNSYLREMVITGSNFDTQFRFGEKIENFSCSLNTSITASENNLHITINNCEIGDNRVRAFVKLTDQLYPSNIRLHELTLKESLLGMLKFLPSLQINAKEILLKDTDVEFDKQHSYFVTGTKGWMEISSLIWGPQNSPYLKINPSIQWNSKLSEIQNTIELKAVISMEGLNTKMKGLVNKDFSYEIETEGNLSLQSLREITPYFFTYIPKFNLEKEILKINSKWKGNKSQLYGEITTNPLSGENAKLSLILKSNLNSIYTTPEIECYGKAETINSLLHFELQSKGKDIKGRLTSEKLYPSDLFCLYSNDSTPDIFRIFNIKFDSSFRGEFPNILNLNLKAENYTHSGEDVLPLAPAKWEIKGSLLDLSNFKGDVSYSSENSLNLAIPNLAIDLNTLNISLPISAQIYMSNIDSKVIEIPLVGLLYIEGNLNWLTNKPLEATFDILGKGLGYPPYILPDNLHINSKGSFEYNSDSSTLIFPLLQLGINDYYPVLVKELYLKLPNNSSDGSPLLKASSLQIDIDGTDLSKNQIIDKSEGKISATFEDLMLNNTELNFETHHGRIENFSLYLPSYKLKFENLNGETTSSSKKNIYCDLTADTVSIYEIAFRSPKIHSDLSIYPFNLLIKNASSTLWNGKITANGSIRNEEQSTFAKVSAEMQSIDLNYFTDEIQPPWLKLTGKGDATLDLLFDFNQLDFKNLDFSLVCNEGISVNRDILLKLIMYLQNIKIVEKRLEKLLGTEDPKKFSYAELNVGYKDKKATVSIFLSTKELQLAPVFYINADWTQLWSLLTMPSDVQLEIK
ncbi:MAG: hypothetical protein N3G21_00565 [Candidatus Hydrogenedentes bacterium]|nr:hypothetical protein [Candidatus Hydrogenedentota bacterium]